jgi:transcriptional regulator with XRE-family HTH domain
MDPGKALHDWRGKRSLNEVGKLIGIDPSYVRYLETGAKKNPSVAVATLIESATGIPVSAWAPEAEPAADTTDPVAESA